MESYRKRFSPDKLKINKTKKKGLEAGLEREKWGQREGEITIRIKRGQAASRIDGCRLAEGVSPIGDGWRFAVSDMGIVIVVPTCAPDGVFWVDHVFAEWMFMVSVGEQQIGVA